MKWGILATGTIAEKFADTVNHMEQEDETLIACASRNLEHGKAFASKYGIPKVYGSYAQMMTDSEVDAVYIATPNSLHYENCRMCLEAGKHVLCEKAIYPLCGSGRRTVRTGRGKRPVYYGSFLDPVFAGI